MSLHAKPRLHTSSTQHSSRLHIRPLHIGTLLGVSAPHTNTAQPTPRLQPTTPQFTPEHFTPRHSSARLGFSSAHDSTSQINPRRLSSFLGFTASQYTPGHATTRRHASSDQCIASLGVSSQQLTTPRDSPALGFTPRQPHATSHRRSSQHLTTCLGVTTRHNTPTQSTALRLSASAQLRSLS